MVVFVANKDNLSDPLAQSAEHLPFKQGVRGSNPRWITKENLRAVTALRFFVLPDSCVENCFVQECLSKGRRSPVLGLSCLFILSVFQRREQQVVHGLRRLLLRALYGVGVSVQYDGQ